MIFKFKIGYSNIHKTNCMKIFEEFEGNSLSNQKEKNLS